MCSQHGRRPTLTTSEASGCSEPLQVMSYAAPPSCSAPHRAATAARTASTASDACSACGLAGLCAEDVYSLLQSSLSHKAYRGAGGQLVLCRLHAEVPGGSCGSGVGNLGKHRCSSGLRLVNMVNHHNGQPRYIWSTTMVGQQIHMVRQQQWLVNTACHTTPWW